LEDSVSGVAKKTINRKLRDAQPPAVLVTEEFSEGISLQWTLPVEKEVVRKCIRTALSSQIPGTLKFEGKQAKQGM